MIGVVMVMLAVAASPGARGQGTATPPAPKLANAPVLLPVAADPTVSFRIAFTVGSQDDPVGKEGLAYLTGTLLAEGATATHPYAEILKLLYPMATEYHVRVGKEVTTFSGRVHKDNVEAYIGLLLDAVMRPAFAEADFARIKQRTIDYLAKTLRYSSDEELGKAALYNTTFAGTTYRHINSGTVEGLKGSTLDDVRAFYRAHFTRDTVVLALGGGYDDKQVARMEQALAQLPAGMPPVVPPPQVKAIAGRQVVIVKKPGPSTAISFGFPLPIQRGSREFYALWVANSWLGEHRNSSSHLYQVIREARGMNYGDYSYIEIFPEGGRREFPPTGVPRRTQLFEVWVRPVPNAQAHFALRAAIREVEKLAADGLSEEQFKLTRDFVAKYSLHFAETTFDRLGYAMDDRFLGVPAPGNLANFREIVPTLTRDEVNAAVRKYIKPAAMVIAIVSEDADQLAEALASDAPSPISYATSKPPEVLEEDKSIQAYPLHITKGAIRIVPVEQMFAR
ncbi:MAG: M16 family metallopeptidase [Thermoanaerobaculales bacterium]